MSNKKRFEVEDGETIAECLQRMEQEGYAPVRRMEEPIFKEVQKNGRIEYEVHRQKIIFEGRKK